MTSPTQKYSLPWSVLVGGLVAWVLFAMDVDAACAEAGSVGQRAVPEWPRSAVVRPANALIEGPSVDWRTPLPLLADSVEGGVEPDAGLPDRVTENALRAEKSEKPAQSKSISPDIERAASPRESETQTVREARYPGVPTTYAAQLRSYRTLKRRAGASARLDLGGLVVDETITPHGRIFYTNFFDVWQPPPVEGFYIVRVREKPTPGRGTLVEVFVNDDVTFRTRVQPQTQISEQALQAARRTYRYVRSGHGILQIR